MLCTCIHGLRYKWLSWNEYSFKIGSCTQILNDLSIKTNCKNENILRGKIYSDNKCTKSVDGSFSVHKSGKIQTKGFAFDGKNKIHFNCEDDRWEIIIAVGAVVFGCIITMIMLAFCFKKKDKPMISFEDMKEPLNRKTQRVN